MYYRLNSQQENDLLILPETGMGYQVVKAFRQNTYTRELFLILNSEVVVEMNGFEDKLVREIIKDGIYSIKSKADYIVLNSISAFSEKQFRLLVNESESERSKGATENPVENANGVEDFVRLSAFEDDKRIDKINKCLRPGSYTTTPDDYDECKNQNDDPIARYALPNNEEIQFAFYLRPSTTDTLQRGKVQPANEQPGGGKEVYFAKGTAKETFLKQTPY
jgi:hypothetical protein